MARKKTKRRKKRLGAIFALVKRPGKSKRKRGKTLSAEEIKVIKKMLDGYRLVHGYELTKRKRKRKR